MFNDKKDNILKLDNSGFTIIESLVAIAIFSIAFMALSTGIWSATTNFRTTSYADDSVMNSQDVIEMLSVIEINDVTGAGVVVPRGDDQMIRYSILNPGAGGDFKTIAIEVYHSDDAVLLPSELRMKTYYRRMVY